MMVTLFSGHSPQLCSEWERSWKCEVLTFQQTSSTSPEFSVRNSFLAAGIKSNLFKFIFYLQIKEWFCFRVFLSIHNLQAGLRKPAGCLLLTAQNLPCRLKFDHMKIKKIIIIMKNSRFGQFLFNICTSLSTRSPAL